MPLVTDLNLPDPDGAYRRLVEAHRGLSADESARFDAALVLILANHVGDEAVLAEAIALARSTLVSAAPADHPTAPAAPGAGGHPA